VKTQNISAVSFKSRIGGTSEHFFKLKHKEKFICIYNDGEVDASSLL